MGRMGPILVALTGAAFCLACIYVLVRDGLEADPSILVTAAFFGSCAGVGLVHVARPQNVRTDSEGAVTLRPATWKNGVYLFAMIALASASVAFGLEAHAKGRVVEQAIAVAGALLFGAGAPAFFVKAIIQAEVFRITRHGVERLGRGGWRVGWDSVEHIFCDRRANQLATIVLRTRDPEFLDRVEVEKEDEDEDEDEDEYLDGDEDASEWIDYFIPVGAHPLTATHDIRAEQLIPIVEDYWRAARIRSGLHPPEKPAE